MGHGSGWTYEALFGPELVSAPRAREFVCAHLRDHGLRQLVDDVGLVVTELVTNSVRHAGTMCVVRLGVVDRSLVLTVQDGSPRLPVRREPGPLDAAGRGMFLVDALSRDWGVEKRSAGSKAVWASFQVPPHSDNDSAG